MSPTQMALKYFRDRGGECVILTCFPKYGNRRKDIWGADFLVRRGKQLMAVQATDETSHGKHVTAAMVNPLVLNWLLAGVIFYVYSEGLRGARGERKLRTPRLTEIVPSPTTGNLMALELEVTQADETLELDLETHKVKAEDTPA